MENVRQVCHIQRAGFDYTSENGTAHRHIGMVIYELEASIFSREAAFKAFS